MNSYLIKKDILLRKFPNLKFIELYKFKFSDYFNYFLNIEIHNNDEVILERIIKINKIQKTELPIGEFLLYIKENQISIHDVIKFVSEKERNKYKYKNYDYNNLYEKETNGIYTRIKY